MLDSHVTYLGLADPGACADTTVRELDSRAIDGLQVDLLWSQREGRAWVEVADRKTGESFSLVVREGERPYDVFHHPYAYAALRGMTTGTERAGLDSDAELAA